MIGISQLSIDIFESLSQAELAWLCSTQVTLPILLYYPTLPMNPYPVPPQTQAPGPHPTPLTN